MKNLIKLVSVLGIFAILFFTAAASSAQPLKVVTTLTDYAWLARMVGGDLVEVKAIVEGDQDAHFIRPKPSFVEILRNADLLIATGLDLEMWLPSAVDKSGNHKIRSGELGYVSAATGMNLMDKPVALSHIEGGLHLYGNPHVTVSSMNVIQAIDNIRIGLSRNLPAHAQRIKENADALVTDVCKNLYGEELLNMLGQQTLLDLHRAGKLMSFLTEKKFKGRPLAEFAGGWLGRLWHLRGTRIVSYHKNWLYLFNEFELLEGGFIEPKPGIPPSPRHLSNLKETMKKQNIKIVIAADYFDEKTVRQVAADTGAVYKMLPYYVGGRQGIDSWIKLMDFWVEQIADAAQKAGLARGAPDEK